MVRAVESSRVLLLPMDNRKGTLGTLPVPMDHGVHNLTSYPPVVVVVAGRAVESFRVLLLPMDNRKGTLGTLPVHLGTRGNIVRYKEVPARSG